MKKRQKKPEEHIDEGWLLPYADMLTLLLALFIVMFAMAKTDDSKLDDLSNEFSVILSGKGGGSDGILPGHPPKKKNQTNEESKTKSEKEEEEKKESSTKQKTKKDEKTDVETNKNLDEERMESVGNSIKDELTKDGHADDIDIDLEQDGLRIAIKSGLLFPPGSAEMTKEVEDIIKKIAESLKDLDNDLIIAGYTDNVPNNTPEYSSNWELSSARAMAVMKLLVKHHGIPENRVSVQSYGEFKPKVPNNSEENRAKNRRVEIFVIKKDRN